MVIVLVNIRNFECRITLSKCYCNCFGWSTLAFPCILLFCIPSVWCFNFHTRKIIIWAAIWAVLFSKK